MTFITIANAEFNSAENEIILTIQRNGYLGYTSSAQWNIHEKEGAHISSTVNRTGEFEFYADEHEKILRIPVSSDSKGKITLSLSDPKLCYIYYQSTWQVDVDIEQRNSFFSIKRLARQKVPEGNEGSARVKQYIVTRHGSDESDEKVEWEVEGTGIYAASETDFKNNSLPSGISHSRQVKVRRLLRYR